MSSARWRRTRSWTGPAPRRGSCSSVPDLPLQALAAQAFTGLVLGGIYVLMAIGLSLIFGLMTVWNFAHGSFYMPGEAHHRPQPEDQAEPDGHQDVDPAQHEA